jgi:hypothetical protein
VSFPDDDDVSEPLVLIVEAEPILILDLGSGPIKRLAGEAAS